MSVALGVVLCVAHAQGPGSGVHRVGVLIETPSAVPASRSAMATLRGALKALGYVEGSNLVIVERYAERGAAQLPALAAELVNGDVDVIVSASSNVTRALQQATKTIPIVMAASADPVEQGFVASLARPGGNITGMSILSLALSEKRLAMLKELVPGASRVAVLRGPSGPNVDLSWRATEATAARMGLELRALVLTPDSDFDRLLASAVRQGTDAVVAVPDPVVVLRREEIARLALKHRLPTMFFERTAVEAGGLASYGPGFGPLFERAASYVDKLLKGAKAADLPVEQPTRFEFYFNVRTAHALGIVAPPHTLMRAEELIR